MSQTVDPSMLEKYNDWLAHPVTVRFNQYLRRERESLKEQWANGSFTAPSAEQTALLTANAVGQCEVLSTLINLEPDQLFSEQDNE